MARSVCSCSVTRTEDYDTGFPSPAADYLSKRLIDDMFCGISMNSRILETSEGYAVIDVSLNARKGDTLPVLADGEMQFVKLAGRVQISEDGEAIEENALGEVQVIGRVTYFINRARSDELPDDLIPHWLDHLRSLIFHIANGVRHGVPDEFVCRHGSVCCYLSGFLPAYTLTHPFTRRFR